MPDPTKTCTWREDEDGIWKTACDHLFEVLEGTPEENDMKFCCYCGKALAQRTFKWRDE